MNVSVAQWLLRVPRRPRRPLRSRSILVAVVYGAVYGAVSVSPAHAADEVSAKRKAPEAFAMFGTLVTKGAEIGPGDGWFHPSESRYGWDWLSHRVDANRDGEITSTEWGENPEAFFARLDRDHSSSIKADDFDWSETSEYLAHRSETRRLSAALDTDSNGRITVEEWAALYTKLAGAKGFLTADDVADWIVPAPGGAGAPPPGAMPSRWTLLEAFFSGELGSFHEGPALDAEAPEFSLATHDRGEAISLSQFKGKKPVVLIFGSFT